MTNAVKTPLSLLLVLAGCENSSRLLLPPPVVGASAVVLEETSQVRLWIFSEWTTEALRIEVEDPSAAEVSAAVFESQALQALGLPEGAVELGATGATARALPLERPEVRIFESRVDGGWREVAEPSPVMRDLRFRDPRLCPDLETESVFIPGPFSSRGFGLGAALDDNTALIGVYRGPIYRVDAERRMQQIELSGLDGNVRTMTASEGELWVATSSGSIFQGPREDPFALSFVMNSSTTSLERMIVTRVGDHQEIVAMDQTRVVWHHDGRAWQSVHQFPDDGTNNRSNYLLEIEPGHVLGSSLGEPRLLRFRDGAFRLEQPSVLPLTGFSRVAHLRGFGSLAAGSLGEIYADASGAWAPHMSPSVSVNIGAMLEVDGALLVASISNDIELIHPERRLLCGPTTVPIDMRVDFMARLGEHTLLTGLLRQPADGYPVIYVRTVPVR